MYNSVAVTSQNHYLEQKKKQQNLTQSQHIHHNIINCPSKQHAQQIGGNDRLSPLAKPFPSPSHQTLTLSPTEGQASGQTSILGLLVQVIRLALQLQHHLLVEAIPQTFKFLRMPCVLSPAQFLLRVAQNTQPCA